LEQKSDFSFLLKFVINPEQLGNIRINGNKIIEFVEKPKANALFLTNSGLYITSRKFLDKHNF
jgi:dTDP-glucose pyrophosphorylase